VVGRQPGAALSRIALPSDANLIQISIFLAVSQNAIYVKERGFNVRWMTWRAMGLDSTARRVKGCK